MLLIYIRNLKGSAGILSIIIMLLLLTIGMYMLAVSSSAVTATGNYRDGLVAQYAAELGIKHAVYQLKYDTTGTILEHVTNLVKDQEYIMPNAKSLSDVIDNVSYTVKYIGVDATTRRIEAVGIVNGKVKRRATLLVTMNTGTSPLFDKYVTYSRSSTVITSGSYITGNVGSLGTVTQYGGIINGNVLSTTANGYTSYSGSVLTGTWNKQTEDIAIPSTLPDFISFSNNAYSSGTKLSGSIYNGGKQTLSGVYYVNGDFEMGSTTFNVAAGSSATIYATGSIRLNSGTMINGNITLIAGGGYVEVNGATISAPNGTVNIYANGYFHDNSNSSISASNITLEAVSHIELNGSPVVNNQGTIKMYTKGYFNFNSNSVITGDCLVMADGNIGLNGGVGKTTIFISNNDIQVNSNSDVGQIYAVKNVYDYGGKITYTKGLAQKLIGQGQVTLNFGSWNNQ